MSFLDSLIPSNWICAVHEKGCFLVNTDTKEKTHICFARHRFERFHRLHTLKHFVWNHENKKIYIIGERCSRIDDQFINYIEIFDCINGLSVYCFEADSVTFQEDGKSLLHTESNGDVTRWWFNYTHKDINVESCKKDKYHFHLHNTKALRAFFDSGERISDLIPYVENHFVTRMELAVKNLDTASVKVLLLKGLNPLFDSDYKKTKKLPEYAQISMKNSYTLAQTFFEYKNILKEMEEWMHDTKAYEHKYSALIPFVFGTASLDWPVLVSTIVAEYLVWVNDDRIAQFTETKSWKIAAVVKQKYREINT